MIENFENNSELFIDFILYDRVCKLLVKVKTERAVEKMTYQTNKQRQEDRTKQLTRFREKTKHATICLFLPYQPRCLLH